MDQGEADEVVHLGLGLGGDPFQGRLEELLGSPHRVTQGVAFGSISPDHEDAAHRSLEAFRVVEDAPGKEVAHRPQRHLRNGVPGGRVLEAAHPGRRRRHPAGLEESGQGRFRILLPGGLGGGVEEGGKRLLHPVHGFRIGQEGGRHRRRRTLALPLQFITVLGNVEGERRDDVGVGHGAHVEAGHLDAGGGWEEARDRQGQPHEEGHAGPVVKDAVRPASDRGSRQSGQCPFHALPVPTSPKTHATSPSLPVDSAASSASA